MVLGSVRLAQAVTLPLAFDYPLDWQPGTSYVLHSVRQSAQGALSARDYPVNLLPQATCTAYEDPLRTAETLCLSVCIDPGDYTFTMRAFRGRQSSDWSAPLDLDATQGTHTSS